MKHRLALACVYFVPLALIAVGCWLIYPPAAFICSGLILLIDLYRKGTP